MTESFKTLPATSTCGEWCGTLTPEMGGGNLCMNAPFDFQGKNVSPPVSRVSRNWFQRLLDDCPAELNIKVLTNLDQLEPMVVHPRNDADIQHLFNLMRFPTPRRWVKHLITYLIILDEPVLDVTAAQIYPKKCIFCGCIDCAAFVISGGYWCQYQYKEWEEVVRWIRKRQLKTRN